MGMDPHGITCPDLLKAAGISAPFELCESRTRLSHSSDHSPPLQPLGKITQAASITRGILHLKVFGKWVQLAALPRRIVSDYYESCLCGIEREVPLSTGIFVPYMTTYTKHRGPKMRFPEKLYIFAHPKASAWLPSALHRHCWQCHYRRVTPLHS